MIMRPYGLFALLASSLLLQPATSETAPPAAAAPAPGPLTVVASGWEDTAAALRRKDCVSPQALVQTRLAQPEWAPAARLLRGLYADACGDAKLAESALLDAAAPGGVLEDWRLFLLAANAEKLGHVPAARAALMRLLEDYPSSPLRPAAVTRAAVLAEESGDRALGMQLLEIGRRESLSDAAQTRLRLLAFSLARRAGDAAGLREAAKRLLILSPTAAADVRAAEVFRAAGGELDWLSFLSVDDILARAGRLLDLDVVDGAMQTLSTVPAAKRDARWFVLQGRALTASRHGLDALKLLAGAAAQADAKQLAELEWERASAALDAATARRGKGALGASARQVYATEARGHLMRAADAGGDPALAARALRRLFGEFGDELPYEQTVQVLRRLHQLDPADDSGTKYLFSRGWQEYEHANYTGAIGHWSELIDLYPKSRTARGAQYWSGRAFAALGQTARAEEIDRQIATADTTDFYRRFSLSRLGGTVPGEAALVRESWPQDAALARARLLSDLGLDALASQEIDAVPAADARSVTALRALILARQGQRRESLRVVRAAFPDLATSRQATVPEEALRLYYPLDYAESVRAVAQAQGLEPHLVFAIIHQESGFDAGAISHAGARGLMQLMSDTGRELARRLGLPYTRSKLTDPDFSVRLGTTYFRQLLGMFDGKLELALASYNSGPGRILRLWHSSGRGDLDRFVEGLQSEETRNYVKRILVISDSYRQLYPSPG